MGDKESTINRFAPQNWVSIILAAVIILAWFGFAWANQPEMGVTYAQTFALERSANEIDIPREALSLIPVAASVAVLIGIWGVLNPKQGRASALGASAAGLLTLAYFIIFFRELPELDMEVLPLMGAGFWVCLVGGVLLVLQFLIPRPVVKGYELGRVFGNQESVIAFGLVLLVFFVGISNPRYLGDRSIIDILSGNAYIAVAAIGMSMVIITGNIDISVGSLIGVLAVISGRISVDAPPEWLFWLFGSEGYPLWFAWFAPLFVGGGVGAVIGVLVAYLRIPSIVVTLGFLSILKGGLIIFTQGERVTGMPAEFLIAQQRPLGIPVPIFAMIILTILAALWMRYSTLGRSLYAVGGNAEAARLSGINEQWVVFRVFIINGVIAGIASLLYATQLNVIQSTPPPALELIIITASVVGGVSILGGTGTVIGSTLAAILLNAIRSSMVFIGVSPFWIRAVQGILILITVLVDILRRERSLNVGRWFTTLRQRFLKAN